MCPVCSTWGQDLADLQGKHWLALGLQLDAMFTQIPVNLEVTYREAVVLAFFNPSLIPFSFHYFSYKFKHGGGCFKSTARTKD